MKRRDFLKYCLAGLSTLVLPNLACKKESLLLEPDLSKIIKYNELLTESGSVYWLDSNSFYKLNEAHQICLSPDVNNVYTPYQSFALVNFNQPTRVRYKLKDRSIITKRLSPSSFQESLIDQNLEEIISVHGEEFINSLHTFSPYANVKENHHVIPANTETITVSQNGEETVIDLLSCTDDNPWQAINLQAIANDDPRNYQENDLTDTLYIKTFADGSNVTNYILKQIVKIEDNKAFMVYLWDFGIAGMPLIPFEIRAWVDLYTKKPVFEGKPKDALEEQMRDTIEKFVEEFGFNEVPLKNEFINNGNIINKEPEILETVINGEVIYSLNSQEYTYDIKDPHTNVNNKLTLISDLERKVPFNPLIAFKYAPEEAVISKSLTDMNKLIFNRPKREISVVRDYQPFISPNIHQALNQLKDVSLAKAYVPLDNDYPFKYALHPHGYIQALISFSRE
jgi:hypothetical protein